MEIRIAQLADAERLLEIYRHYVVNTAVTFEYDVPSLEEFRRRMSGILLKYPYLAAVENGRILGYAYAGPFHARAAYGWCAEMTVYVAPDARRSGIGRQLYQALEEALGRMGVLNLYACIACLQTEDEYLTLDSVRFHERMGYVQNGLFKRCGYKFGRWYDMVWMEKIIGEHKCDQPSVIAFPLI